MNKGLDQLWQQLYPSGRAFDTSITTNRELIHSVINDSFEKVLLKFDSIITGSIPDNDFISEQEIELLEYKWGIYFTEGLTLEQRKKRLLEQIAYPDQMLCRSNANYIQHELNKNGFDVIVSENPDYLAPGLVMRGKTIQLSENIEHGFGSSMGGSKFRIIANSMNPNESFNLGGVLWATFFIKINTAIIGNKMSEFRELVLRLKPAHLVAVVMNVDEGLGDFNDDFSDDFNIYIR